MREVTWNLLTVRAAARETVTRGTENALRGAFWAGDSQLSGESVLKLGWKIHFMRRNT